jgi:hypothetical protein
MAFTPSGRIKVYGKQVTLDGEHLADAVNEEAAQGIAAALDFAGVGFGDLPTEASKAIWKVLA